MSCVTITLLIFSRLGKNEIPHSIGWALNVCFSHRRLLKCMSLEPTIAPVVETRTPLSWRRASLWRSWILPIQGNGWWGPNPPKLPLPARDGCVQHTWRKRGRWAQDSRNQWNILLSETSIRQMEFKFNQIHFYFFICNGFLNRRRSHRWDHLQRTKMELGHQEKNTGELWGLVDFLLLKMLCLILRLRVNAWKKFMVYFLKLFWHLWKLTSSHFIRKLHMFMFFLQSTHSRSDWWRGGLCEGHEDFYLQPAAPSGIKPQCSHSHPEPERDHFQEHQGHRVAPWEVTTHTNCAPSDKNRFIGLVLSKNPF